MYLPQKHLSRRTVLRGMGVTMALPLLDAMIPARTLLAKSVAVTRPRLIAIEMVHGAAGSTEYGIKNNLWAPAGVGSDFDLSPSCLSALEPYRDHLTIVSNTDVRNAEAFEAREVGGDHFRSSAVFLTQMRPRQTESSDVRVGVSLDQLYAQRYGQDTPIPSMQLCIENVDQSGGCAYGYACVYTDTISWASPTEPLPMVRDPRVAFDQLFGAGATAAERTVLRRTDRSILDFITNEIRRVSNDLGASDRRRLDQYLGNVREVERRLQKVEAHNQGGEPRELPGAPIGVPDAFDEHVKLMYDLQALAFTTDATRVFSFKLGRDGSGRVYPESGSKSSFHPASHHQDKDDRILEFQKINRYHVGTVTYLLDKLKSTMDGEGSLLDNTLIIYGSPMGNSNLHNHKRVPLFLAGKAGGALKGNTHVKAPDGTSMANVWLTLLHRLGLDDVQSFGDSTGEITL